MKLFTRYNRLNLIATVLIFVLSSIAYYFLLRYVIINQFDDNLVIEQSRISSYAGKYNKLPEIIAVKDQLVTIDLARADEPVIFITIPAYDIVGDDVAEFRELFFSVKAGTQWYRVMVGKSMEGVENLFQSIIAITLIIILLILVVSFVINRIVLNKLWQPFYRSLEILKDFKIGRKNSFTFPASHIEEFSFMNNVLRQTTSKADNDYLLLKEFTENASHEMQTPLAIIRSKLDLVIQDEKVSQSHELNLQALYKATEKLSKLNRSLLLLTKIENNQFYEKGRIDLKERLRDKIGQMQEIFLDKEIFITSELGDAVVSMNNDLADIMLNNLFSNAVKHNNRGGTIHVQLTGGAHSTLTVNNSSPVPALDQKKIFTRFYKSGESNEHTGLGLSILKQICIASGCDISYEYRNNLHFFTINWMAD